MPANGLRVNQNNKIGNSLLTESTLWRIEVSLFWIFPNLHYVLMKPLVSNIFNYENKFETCELIAILNIIIWQ